MRGLHKDDRPGRYFAVLVFAPLLVLTARNVTHPTDAARLGALGMLLFLYECFWISRSHAEIVSLAPPV